nr:D-2-hydroxyacid dehydrogenase [Paludisphaera mucosa]
MDAFGAVEYHDVTAPDEVAERASGAEVLIINKCPIRADLIAGLPDLRFIAVTATGFDCVDVEAAKGREIVVSNVRGYSTDSVAQVTFALILELTLHVGLHSDAVLAGEWAAQPDFSIRKSPLIELAGKTLGIVGLGRIGRRVAEVAGAFGMNVIAHRPSGKPPAPDDPIPAFALEDLFRRADVVTLHCPLTPKTKGLVNRELLRLAKPTAFLINTGRGPLVVEQDLADALNEGLIAGAGVDVVSREPIDPANPLLKAKNIVITPHIAWATAEARERLMAATVENVAAYAAGKPINLVG